MNLMDLMVKIGVDDQASGKVSEIGGQLKSGLGSAAKAGAAAVAAGVTAVAGATAALGKSALDAYASYEQLVGGVDTLFKEASATVQANAAQAYKTAGVSANKYMEQATSFAASLVSSLGGDTAKAAAYADKAIGDMSDNANKMGTDIESLQFAYQGFAKANFTMLDNLKLGYGGTKEEMQRLIDDANKVKEANGEMADLSIDSFADVVEAIHTVQQEMDITGTTALEAATTIEGSIATMKGAWENWLAGLGNGEADMAQLTDELVASFTNVADNVIPRLGVIFGTVIGQIPSIVSETAPAIGDALSEAFSTAADNLYETLTPEMQEAWDALTAQVEESGLAEAAQGVFDSIGQAADGAVEAIDRIVGAFDGMQGLETATAGLEVFQGFIDDISEQANEFLAPAVENLVQQFNDLMAALEEAQPWLEPLAEFIGDVLVAALIFLVDVLTIVVGLVTKLIEGINWFIEKIKEAPDAIEQFCTDVETFFSELPGKVWEWLQGVIDKVNAWGQEMAAKARQAGSDFANSINTFFAELPGRIGGFLQSVISRVAEWAGSMAAKAGEAARSFGERLISGLQSIPGRVADIGRQIIEGIAGGVSRAAGRVVSAVTGAVNGAINAAKRLLGIASPSKLFRKFGVFTMQGMEKGIEAAAGLPAKAMRAATLGVAAAGSLDAPVPAFGRAEGGGFAQTINVYQPVRSPSELAREMRRQARYGLAGARRATA